MAVKKISGNSPQATADGQPTGGAAERASWKPVEPKVKKPGQGWRSEKQRRTTLEYAKRTVWANLQAIVEAAIRQSLSCNYSAAKFLCDFADVAELPEPEAPETQPTNPANPYEMSDANAMEWFFDRLGIKPPESEDEENSGQADC